MKTFADFLREARKKTGLTQTELADQAGIDHSYISKIERGVDDPPARDKVLAIVDVLGITDRSERAAFLLAAGCASSEDLWGLSPESQETNEATEPTIPFEAFALHFPDTDKLEEDSLVGRIRQLLSNPALSREQRAEYIDDLSSFVAWLEFKTSTTGKGERKG